MKISEYFYILMFSKSFIAIWTTIFYDCMRIRNHCLLNHWKLMYMLILHCEDRRINFYDACMCVWASTRYCLNSCFELAQFRHMYYRFQSQELCRSDKSSSGFCIQLRLPIREKVRKKRLNITDKCSFLKINGYF